MAEKQSSSITNTNTGKQNDSFFDRGTVQVSSAKAVIAAADADGDFYRLVTLPAGAKVINVLRTGAAVTGGTDFDLGFYETKENGGAVIDKDAICDGADLSAAGNSASLMWKNLEGSADVEKRAHELCVGVTGAKRPMDLCLTGNTVGSGTATQNFEIFWTV